MKTILKLFLIGLLTTPVRILGQLMIPAGNQNILPPSIFAENGTMPLAFSIYGIFAYSLIAALFLLIRRGMPYGKIKQGLFFGLSCCAIWILYLWEPLPHVAPLDKLTYPIADSIALMAMGLFTGILLGTNPKPLNYSNRSKALPLAIIALCFILGRLVLYYVFDIYSSAVNSIGSTLLWTAATGIGVALVMTWLNRQLPPSGRLKKSLILGGLLFGVDLFLFNFFMPLVFATNLSDLLLRTGMDIFSVSLGCLGFSPTTTGVASQKIITEN